MMKSEFIPCKECIECGLDMFENEPYYYCKLQKLSMYTSMKDMIKNCPVKVKDDVMINAD